MGKSKLKLADLLQQNMTAIYNQIVQAKAANKKLLAILLDPDKIVWDTLDTLISKINKSPATHIFIGGSLVYTSILDDLITKIKQSSSLPVVLFPGDPSQISDKADAILFLSLISGRNPDFLIGHQVQAAPIIKKTQLEVISTGYMLIASGRATAVEIVSQTIPLARENYDYAVATAHAGEMLGNKLIYLEAGSGAELPVPLKMINLVAQNIAIPLVVGGGIMDKQGIQNAYDAGADLVVIGTAFENDIHFFENK